MKSKNVFRLTKGMKERRKVWAKKQLEIWLPYEKWVAAGNFSEDQLRLIKRTIEEYQTIAEYGYIKTIKSKTTIKQ